MTAKNNSGDAAGVAVRRVFPDGYDLDAEEKAVRHLLDADEPNPVDAAFDRYEVYLERCKAWARLLENHAARHAAQADVPVADAAKIQALGALRAEEEDTMTLHTLEAVRLFMGVSPAPGESFYPIPGARRAATALRQLFFLTANDNPYADWVLVNADAHLARIKDLANLHQKKHLALIEDAKKMGLNYSLMSSRQPQTVGMGYRSPYGHALSMLIAVYDQAVLAIKSCEYRDLVSSNDAHRVFQLIKRECRSMFAEVIRAANQLVQPELRDLSRSDFLPQASELAVKRVAAVSQLFDKVPQDVFTGQRVPRHSMRRVRLSAADAALLKQLALLMHQEPAVSSGAAAAVVSPGLVE